MKFFTFTKIASLTVCLISAASLAQAQVISVNFYNNWRGPGTEYVVDSSAGVVNAGNWNNFNGPGGVNGDGVHNGLLNSSGTATAAYINYAAGTDGQNMSVWGLGVQSSTVLNANAGLYNNFLNYFNNRSVPNTGIIYIGGLGTEFTGAGYNVIVYFADPDAGWQGYALTDTNNVTDTRYGLTAGGGSYANNPFGGFVQSTATNPGDATLSNYVVLSGFSGAGFSLIGEAQSGARPAIVGFQIVAVPEPGTITLAVLGAGAILLMVRRRRQA